MKSVKATSSPKGRYSGVPRASKKNGGEEHLRSLAQRLHLGENIIIHVIQDGKDEKVEYSYKGTKGKSISRKVSSAT